ncbi:MAG: GNAT family N-acetyltransferase [Verrucomicrobia bacterium]|nr:GNAT family N-acetyltransferase [Verrucomicrobiota bacterium]
MRKLRASYVKPPKLLPGMQIRVSEEADGEFWGRWLEEPDVARAYPSEGPQEREESTRRMQLFAKHQMSLTALFEGEVAGIAYLNLHPYRKIAHQALFTIIVGGKFRGKGIGTCLLEHLEKMGRDNFGLEGIHLEVYENNPALRLYRRMGYREFGMQSHWIKEAPGEYRAKIYMEKWF